MPHILFLVLGILIFMSLLTYVIPAGQFAQDETGKLLGDQFEFLGYQTPVSVFRALMLILDGLTKSGQMIGLLFCGGAFSGVVLATGAVDRAVDFAIYKLKDKGVKVLVPVVFFVYSFVGAFQGGDQIIAMLPIGIAFAKKLKLDPIVAFSVILLAFQVGGLSSPTWYAMIPQVMMGVELYSGFAVRVLMWLILTGTMMFIVTRYALKILKDPLASPIDPSEWWESTDMTVTNSTGELKEAHLSVKDVIVLVLFLSMPLVSLALVSGMGLGTGATAATMLVMGILIGFVHGFDMNKIGNAISDGTASMAFVGFIIGLATTLSLIMSEGNIVHTIVYYASIPLQIVPRSLAVVGMNIVISLINLFIPSASAKAAILVPIVTPLCETLGVTLQVGVQSFLYGDKLTNIISPVLGTTVAGLAMCRIDFSKWAKWVLPKLLLLACICWASLIILNAVGWM